jgi:putative oxidoreductase
MNNISLLIGRVLLALIFLLAGINKISGYAGTQAYMEAMGVNAMLLPFVIALEIAGGLAIIIGWQTRWAAYALALFTLLAAFLFHFNFSEQMQTILFMKNIAIVGGFLLLSVAGPGLYSLDARRQR